MTVPFTVTVSFVTRRTEGLSLCVCLLQLCCSAYYKDVRVGGGG
jgi:hypothetical protein